MDTTTTAKDVRTALSFYAVMLVGGLLGTWLVTTVAGAFLCVVVASGLMVWASNRFEHVLPFGWSPWSRIMVVTMILIAFLIVIPSVVGRFVPTTSGYSIDEVLLGYGGLLQAFYLLMLGVLLVVGTLLTELFFRGVLYSLLDDWRGPGLAVTGSTVAFVGMWMVIFPPNVWHSAAVAVGTGVLLAGSRWLTGSLAPAMVAQGMLAFSGVAFLALVALDRFVG